MIGTNWKNHKTIFSTGGTFPSQVIVGAYRRKRWLAEVSNILHLDVLVLVVKS